MSHIFSWKIVFHLIGYKQFFGQRHNPMGQCDCVHMQAYTEQKKTTSGVTASIGSIRPGLTLDLGLGVICNMSQ